MRKELGHFCFKILKGNFGDFQKLIKSFKLHIIVLYLRASLMAQTVKNLPAVQETWVWSLGWEEALGGGHGNPLQYSCLENPMDRGIWQATVHGVAKSRTWLRDCHLCLQLYFPKFYYNHGVFWICIVQDYNERLRSERRMVFLGTSWKRVLKRRMRRKRESHGREWGEVEEWETQWT